MARDFDGTNDQIDYGDIAGADGGAAHTISLWTKPDSVAAAQEYSWLAGKRNTTANTGWSIQQGGSAFSVNPSAVFALIGATSGAIPNAIGATPNSVLSTTAWTHVCVVFDGSLSTNANRLKIYINGVQQTLGFFREAVPAAIPANAETVTLGEGLGGDPFYDGKHARYSIWNTALNANQVMALARGAIPPRVASGLQLWSELIGTSPEPDWSGNDSAGTVTEAAVFDHPPFGPWFGFDTDWRSGAIPGRIAKNTRAAPLGVEVGMGWRMGL